MARSPLYLSQDRHGVYHFRARVPASLRHHFNNKAEIKRTLQTDSRKEAVRLARAYRVEIDKKIEELTAEELRQERAKLRSIPPFSVARVIEAERPVIHDDGTTEVIKAKMVREGMGPDADTAPLRKEIRDELRQEAEFKIGQKRAAELHRAKLVNQHGKLSRDPGKSPLKSFHPGRVSPSGIFAGVTWSVGSSPKFAVNPCLDSANGG
jgi:hypothetical protein